MTLSRIHIFGASGTGTTTLARAVADRLRCPAFDTDDVYWLPTDPPFQAKRPVGARLELLRAALSGSDDWVLGGSLCGWGDPLVSLFDIVVFLELDTALRLQRLRAREAARFGAHRLAAGGDLEATHEAFIAWAAGYDAGGIEMRSRQLHEAWLGMLPSRIRVVRLESGKPLADLVAAVVRAIVE